MQNSKNAFTMIELIFVIVILGILAAEFTANGAFNNYTVANANNEVTCFVFALNNAADGNISLAVINPASPTCPTVVLNAVAGMATKNGLTNTSGALKNYVFGSAGIVK